MKMRLDRILRYAVVLIAVCLSGCAGLATRQQVGNFQRPPEYEQFYRLLDESVKAAGVRDAAQFTIKGFPYLRTNRFLADAIPELNSDERRRQWVAWMQELELAARQKEIQNLPAPVLRQLTGRLKDVSDRKALYRRTTMISEKLLSHDMAQPGFYQTLMDAVSVPTEYTTALRVIGIYPLTSMPVTAVTRRVQQEFKQWHHAPADQLQTAGELTAYLPGTAPAHSEEIVGRILERSSRNALGVPRPSAADRRALFAMFAPVIYQDVAADYDEIGEIVWLNGKVTVNPGIPTVYHYLSHSRLQSAPVLQLNYVFWYRARSGPLSPRIERGPLDGLSVRVSLDSGGRPFMVDIMNNCGCYHYYVPRRQMPLTIVTPPGEIEPFVPRRLPESYPRERLRLRVVSGWHQVDHLNPNLTPVRSVPYQLSPYDRLEMLPLEDQGFESMFNARGIAKDSPRMESLIFFPMGVTDIGSMRQRGHHAILFIGRAHFDEPDLFDRHFEFQLK
jgi:hypothetical protein